MSRTFETVRENTISAEERFRRLVESKRNRSKNLDSLQLKVAMESSDAAAMLELEEIDEACAAKEKKIKNLDSMKEACAQKRKKEGKIALEEKLCNQGKKSVLEMVIFEMVYNAYVADEDFKENTLDQMFTCFKEQMEVLEAKCNKKEDTKFISEVKCVVEEACKKAAKRIAKESEDKELHEIKFTLTEEEEDELDANLADLGKDEIEDLVKDKVVQVIKDEKELNTKKAQMIQDIDDKLEEFGEELTVEESFQFKNLSRKKTSIRNAYGDTLFNAIMMETSNNIDKDIVNEGLEVKSKSLVMDTVLVESILKYTVLEMANTLGLYDFRKDTVVDLVKKFTFSK